MLLRHLSGGHVRSVRFTCLVYTGAHVQQARGQRPSRSLQMRATTQVRDQYRLQPGGAPGGRVRCRRAEESVCDAAAHLDLVDFLWPLWQGSLPAGARGQADQHQSPESLPGGLLVPPRVHAAYPKLIPRRSADPYHACAGTSQCTTAVCSSRNTPITRYEVPSGPSVLLPCLLSCMFIIPFWVWQADDRQPQQRCNAASFSILYMPDALARCETPWFLCREGPSSMT